MPKKKYIISLTAEERKQLEQLTKTGKAPAYKINHARILLKADTNQDEGGWTDKHISQALDVSISTIERVRQRWSSRIWSKPWVANLSSGAKPVFWMENKKPN